MCNYNGIKINKAATLELFQRKKTLQEMERALQSGFDYSDWPIVKPYTNNDWNVEMAHWEFVAPWTKSAQALKENRKKYATLNATSERLLESKLFREAALKRRCLVLSSGFYEWRHYQPAGAKKPITYPYHLTIASETAMPLFFMAGIYQPTVDFETGEVKDSFAIITTAANSLMSQVHNLKKRMPTILPLHLAEEWLHPTLPEERITAIASYQYPSNEMRAHTIRKDFRTTPNPGEHFDYPELPLLVL